VRVDVGVKVGVRVKGFGSPTRNVNLQFPFEEDLGSEMEESEPLARVEAKVLNRPIVSSVYSGATIVSSVGLGLTRNPSPYRVKHKRVKG